MSHHIGTPINGVIGMAGMPLHSDLSTIEAGEVELAFLNFDLENLLDGVEALRDSRIQGKGLNFYRGCPDVTPVLMPMDCKQEKVGRRMWPRVGGWGAEPLLFAALNIKFTLPH